jgi:hypothetical protein
MGLAIAFLVLCAAVAWVFAVGCIAQRNGTREFRSQVIDVVPGPDPTHPYGVKLDGEPWSLSFRRPPGLDAGGQVSARYDLAGRYVGWTAYGRYTPKQDQPSTVVFFLPLGLAVYLTGLALYISRGGRVPEGSDDAP